MNKKPKTYVCLIVDRSGSMEKIRTQAVENYNEQVQQMQENSKDQDIFGSLISFNGNVFEHKWNVPAAELSEADMADYNPNGSTNLYDAMGYAIEKLMETADKEGDVAFFVQVISDGDNTDQGQYNCKDVRNLVKACEAKGNWTFGFLGCSKEFLEELSKQTAIPISNMAAWTSSNAVAASFAMAESTNRNSRVYRARASGGRGMSSKLYSDDASCCADYTMNTAPNAPKTSKSNLGTGSVNAWPTLDNPYVPKGSANAFPAWNATADKQNKAFIAAVTAAAVEPAVSSLKPVKICRKNVPNTSC